MKKILFLIFFGLFIGLPIIANAGVLPPCTATGNCGFCDMMFTVNAIMRWIVLVAGSGALLMFVWGGFLFVTAAGEKGRVKKGTDVLKNTIFGVVVVFIAWAGVNFVINKVAGTSKVMTFTDTQQVEWYNLCIGTKKDDCVGKGDGYPCGDGLNRYCLNGGCQDVGKGNACSWLNSQGGFYKQYNCYPVGPNSKCGVKTVSECDIASNCIKNLCGKDNFNVCCIPK